MKPSLPRLLAAVACALFAGPFVFGQTLNFGLSSAPVGSLIAFYGTNAADTITFTPGTGGDHFGIGVTSPELASLGGLTGRLDGTFTVGNVSVVSGFQSAPIAGTGTFSISDGLNSISADLTLNSVVKQTASATGYINSALETNVLTFSGYSGANAGMSLLAGRSAVFNLTFQFPGATPTLTGLMGDGAENATSFNGTVSLVAIPEPSDTAVWLAVPALVVAGMRWRRRAGWAAA